MLGALAKKIFGSSNDRRVKGFRPRVAAINALEPEISALSDEQLRARTQAFRDQLAAGTRLDDLECPALVLWATSDPYIGVEQGRWYEAALADARLALIDDAGPWLWLDRPDVVDKVVDHMAPLA